MLASAAIDARAQTLGDSWTNTFDTAGSIASWNHCYDLTEPSYNSPMAWDSAFNNTAGDPSSGSLFFAAAAAVILESQASTTLSVPLALLGVSTLGFLAFNWPPARLVPATAPNSERAQ